MVRAGSAEQVSLSAGNGWRCLPPMQRSLHTLHLILRCTALPVVGLQGTSRAAPPHAVAGRRGRAHHGRVDCTAAVCGATINMVMDSSPRHSSSLPPPVPLVLHPLPMSSSPLLPLSPLELRVSGYLNMSRALRGGGLAIKPHGAERWTIKPFESIKAKQHHFLASWHFYGRLGRGGRHQTLQLAGYKLNEAKQNHPDSRWKYWPSHTILDVWSSKKGCAPMEV